MAVVSPTLVEDLLYVVTARINNPAYDFDFERVFACRHRNPELGSYAVARLGAFEDYEEAYSEYGQAGIHLVHTPEQHFMCTRLSNWYPLLRDLTPRSLCYERPPESSDVEAVFRWPVFVKGERQTSRHRASASVIHSAVEFDAAMSRWHEDPILKWQQITVREFVPLRPVAGGTPGKISPSFEFRTFWWFGKLVGFGTYWTEADRYTATQPEHAAAVAIARTAVEKVGAPFLVVDVAQTADSRWIVIECNDGQESGYAGVSPIELWNNVLDAIRSGAR